MSRRTRYFLSVIAACAVALSLALYSFSSMAEKAGGQYISFPPGTLVHSPRSNAFSRHFWKSAFSHQHDSLFRIAVLAIGKDGIPLRDSLVKTLRLLLNDPRNGCEWSWSRNWDLPADKSNYIFSRPSVPVNLNPGSSHHDYISAWVECHYPPGPPALRLCLISRCRLPGTGISILRGDSLSEELLADDGCWHFSQWLLSGERTQLNLSCETSPEIGAITIEPQAGFSTWPLLLGTNIRRSQSEDLSRQLSLLHPGLIFITGNPDEIRRNFSIVQKLFQKIPLIVCAEADENGFSSFVLASRCGFFCTGPLHAISSNGILKTVLSNELLSCRKFP